MSCLPENPFAIGWLPVDGTSASGNTLTVNGQLLSEVKIPATTYSTASAPVHSFEWTFVEIGQDVRVGLWNDELGFSFLYSPMGVIYTNGVAHQTRPAKVGDTATLLIDSVDGYLLWFLNGVQLL